MHQAPKPKSEQELQEQEEEELQLAMALSISQDEVAKEVLGTALLGVGLLGRVGLLVVA